LLLLLVLLLRYTLPIISSVTVLLPGLLILVGPGSSRVPFYLMGDIVAY